MVRDVNIISNLVIIYIVSFYIGLIICGKCPKPATLKPCICENDSITCEGDQEFKLQNIFSKLSHILDENEKSFSNFTLSNTNISEMVENTFQEITFKYILLKNTTNLKSIQSHTFSTTASTILEFQQLGESQIDDNNGLSEAMSSMVNVRKIVFDGNHWRHIRNRIFRNIFGEQKHLETIDFNPNLEMIKRLESVGNFAFYYLLNLRYINFFGHRIDNIGTKSFDFFKTSNNTLEIDLSENNLNGSSFRRGTFLRAKRPLFINLWNNPIEYLDPKIFKPFLEKDQRNQIKVGSDRDVRFECDCRSFWIFEMKHKIKQQLNDVLCKSGQSIWSLTEEHFIDCME